mgnify:CR=1 FL=1
MHTVMNRSVAPPEDRSTENSLERLTLYQGQNRWGRAAPAAAGVAGRVRGGDASAGGCGGWVERCFSLLKSRWRA